MNKRSFVLLLLLAPPLWAVRFAPGDLDVSLRHYFNSSVRLVSATGDFNGDGKEDICMQEADDKFALILGGGLPKQSDLSLIPRTTILLPIAGSQPTPPFFADINGDGKDDLFVPTPTNLTLLANVIVYVIFGSSVVPVSVNLAATSDLALSFPVNGVLGTHFGKGDFDGDGKEDVVMSGAVGPGTSESFLLLGRSVAGRTNINLNDGVSAVRFHKYPASIAAPTGMGDLNGDGLADLILSDQYADIAGRSDAGQSYIIFGTTVPFLPGSMDWDYAVKPANVTITGRRASGNMVCQAVGDFTGDGKADLALVEGGPLSVILWDGGIITGAGPQVDLAVGIPGHGPVWSLGGILAAPSFSQFGDFDGDGRKDFFTIDNALQVTGGLSTTPLQQSGGPMLPSDIGYASADSFDLGDINGDGKKDLVVLGLDGSLGVLYGFRPLNNPSVQIRSGSVPPKLVLDFSVEGEPTEVKISGDVVDSEKDRWFPYQASLPVTVSQTEGAKTLRVVFRNALGRESSEVQTTLTLDSATPGVQVVGNVIDSQNEFARVDCHVDAPAHVKAAVHDQSGALIAGVLDADLPAGVWPMEWNGKNDSGRTVGPGVYYLVVEKDGKSEKRKILVQR
jgi:hypothetical protein